MPVQCTQTLSVQHTPGECFVGACTAKQACSLKRIISIRNLLWLELKLVSDAGKVTMEGMRHLKCLSAFGWYEKQDVCRASYFNHEALIPKVSKWTQRGPKVSRYPPAIRNLVDNRTG